MALVDALRTFMYVSLWGKPVISVARGLSGLIKSIFRSGEQGFAYDINDISTLFQDAAGTTPVTAAGQPVGLVLDKSKGLVLGGELVVNGDFSNGLTGWTPVVTAPGTVNIVNGTAELIAVGTGAVARLRNLLTVSSGIWYKVQVDVTGNTSASTVLQLGSTAGGIDYGNFALVTGKNTFYVYVAGTNLHVQFYKGTNNGTVYIDNVSIKSISGNHAYQTTSSMRPLLQRNATTGAYYLAFDGTDDYLVTSSIDFTATDKVSLFAGVRKLSDGAQSLVAGLGIAAGNGTFSIFAPSFSGGKNFAVWSKGTLLSANAYSTTHTSPVSAVITGKANIAGDSTLLRINGVSIITDTADQGTGNYSNLPLYIGRNNGATFPLNGHLYSLVGIARLSTDAETIALEKSIAKNVGVML